MITLSNEKITIKLKPAGAELCSIYNHKTGLEYIWQAGKEWPKHSPVLFPIVGSLKDGSFLHKGKSYPLDRHGFARTKEFKILKQEVDSVSFLLKDDEETQKVFPFQFELMITYKIAGNQVDVIYNVKNTGAEEMYFSIGAHPAFKVPLTDTHDYEDYYLEFNQQETAARWPLADGLLEQKPLPFFNDSNIVPLNKELFHSDALVFKNLKSEHIGIKNNRDDHYLDFYFKGYPFFGIWAAKNADFVCLEPWQGVTDAVDSDRMLEHKEGILKLAAYADFSCQWSVAVY
jgi:galactose mutarotase-like enzyme